MEICTWTSQYFLNACHHHCEDWNLWSLLFYHVGGGGKCIHWPIRQMTHIKSKPHVTLYETHVWKQPWRLTFWRWECDFVIVCLWQINQMAAFGSCVRFFRHNAWKVDKFIALWMFGATEGADHFKQEMYWKGSVYIYHIGKFWY